MTHPTFQEKKLFRVSTHASGYKKNHCTPVETQYEQQSMKDHMNEQQIRAHDFSK
jgi:hypothetical protein